MEGGEGLLSVFNKKSDKKFIALCDIATCQPITSISGLGDHAKENRVKGQ